MKKNVVVLAMLALVIGSAVAADISASVEIGTGIDFNTADMDKSEYFTGPNYDDVELSLGIEGEMFGAYTAFGATSTQGIEMYDTYAWVTLGALAQITIGDFSTSIANEDYVLNMIDEYALGILRYNVVKPSFHGDNTIKGDELGNLMVDFYAGPATIQLAWMTPFLPSETVAKGGRHLNYGGRIYTSIEDLADITFTTTYDNPNTKDSTADERTTIGAFVGLPQFYSVIGYTMSIRMNDDNKLDHGIDMRSEMIFWDILFASHWNMSLYGANTFVMYGEFGAGMDLSDDMYISLIMRDQIYYNDVFLDIMKWDVHELGLFLDFDYAVNEFATISTGLSVTGIDNKTADIVVGIPFTLAVSF